MTNDDDFYDPAPSAAPTPTSTAAPSEAAPTMSVVPGSAATSPGASESSGTTDLASAFASLDLNVEMTPDQQRELSDMLAAIEQMEATSKYCPKFIYTWMVIQKVSN